VSSCQHPRLLSNIKHVFSVSGGSILAAHLATHWQAYIADFDKAVRPLIAFGRRDVLGKILRCPWNWPRRTGGLVRMYDRHLFNRATLDALNPEGGPSFHVLATNLTEGGSLWFSRGELRSLPPEGSDAEIAEPVALFPLARAVAASSAFPPVFASLRISRDDLASPDRAPKLKVEPWLTDGGVFDNTGFNSAMHLDRTLRFDRILVSDATAPFDWDYEGRYWFLPRVNRATDVLMHRVSLLERMVHKEELRNQPGVSGTHRVDWLLIDREIGQRRTSLDLFSREEIRLLIWSGYLTAAESFGSSHPSLLWDPCPPVFARLTQRLPSERRSLPPSEATVPALKAAVLRRAQRLRPERQPDGTAGQVIHCFQRGLRRAVAACMWLWRQYVAVVMLPVLVVFVLPLWRAPSPTVKLENIDLARPKRSDVAGVGGGCATFFSLAPTGQRLAVTQGRTRRLTIVELSNPSQDLAIDAADGAASPFFRDNGAEVAFVLGHDLKRADLSASPPQVTSLCEHCIPQPLRGGSWQGSTIVIADGRQVAACEISDKGNCTLRSLVAAAAGESVAWPTLGKGNRVALFEREAGGASRIEVVDMTTNAIVSRRVALDNARHPEVLDNNLLFERAASLFVAPIDATDGSIYDSGGTVVAVRALGSCSVFEASRSGLVACQTTAAPETYRVVRVSPQGGRVRSEVIATVSGAVVPRFVGNAERVVLYQQHPSTGGATTEYQRNSLGEWAQVEGRSRETINETECRVARSTSGVEARVEMDSSCRPEVVIERSDQRVRSASEPLWSSVKGQENLLFFRQAGELRYMSADARKDGESIFARKLRLDPIDASSHFAIPWEGGCRLYDHSQGHFVIVTRGSAGEDKHLSVERLVSGSDGMELWTRFQRAGYYRWRWMRRLSWFR
jgi:predicted acylesterase/phospholipase RssA